MKNLSYLVLSLMLVLSCGLFVACGSSEDGSITLSASNVSIYLGETENNTALVNALPNHMDVNVLDIIYDNTYIKITQGQKLADGSFNLSIMSKVTDFGTTTPISVEVKAGDVSAVFYVELILPVQNIQAKSDAHVAYNGTQTSLYLPNCITFEPAGTKQTGVEFILDQELSYAHIEENYLIIDSGAQVNFVAGEIPSIKVKVASTVEGKSSIGTEFNVKIIPNIELLADVIDIRLDYNGADNVVLENTDYNLSISKNESTGNFQIDTFNVKISIPATLGIEVDIDTKYPQNILNYLTYSKSISQDNSNPANVLDVYTFIFEANTTLQGEGYLRFNYKYTDYIDDTSLSATFVGLATDNTLVDKLKISVLMPISDIGVVTDCSINNNEQYVIYQNYQDGIKGSSISFVALPYGTIQKDLVLVKSEDCSLILLDSKGQLLGFEYNETKLRYEYAIQSNDVIYVKGGTLAQETLKCYSLAPGKESIVKEIVFSVLEGGSGLFFVDNINDVNGLESKTVYMQHQVPAEVFVYSPGSTIDDFIYNSNQVIVSNTEVAGYYKLTFSQNLAVGDYVINISTINGYSIQAILKVIEHITSVNVTLGDNSSYISGVGYSVIKNNDIANVGLVNGYSAKLNYITNEDAVVSRVEYSFYEKNISVYDNAVKNLKDVTNVDYLKINGINEFDFVEASNYISTQNLNLMHLLTATSTGIVVIKINIYGQLVDNGNVRDEIVATKYLYVEVYNPVKKIESSAKNISLRAENQLDADLKYLSETTIDLSVLSENNLIATYDKAFIDLGKYEITPGADGEEDKITSTFVKKINNQDVFKVVYDYNAKTITINVFYVDETIASTIQTITLIAGDFVNINNGVTVFKDELSDYNLKTFNINLTILQTSVIEDISVSNLTLQSETENTYNIDGSLAVRGEKTYSTIYIDTSKSSSVTYKLYTEILPVEAFNKNLDFTFNPNSGYSQAMIDISNDGTLTVLSTQGGTGVITIRPADSHSNAKTVRIPIVVADGNSWETAYEISSLTEIIDTNKHYVLTNPTTYLLEHTILKDLTFNGGLYGIRNSEKDTSTTYATIRLTGESLFTELGANAEIICLNICGDVYSNDKEFADGADYNNGFVAFVNKGIISDVKVTTYVNENGVYVPSTLFVDSDINSVGGFVGENSGTISNCTFAGSINIADSSANITANAFIGNNAGLLENCTVIIAKFSSEVALDRIIADLDNDRKDKTETYYVNGVVDNRNGSPRTKSLFDDVNGTNVAKKRYDGDKYVLDKNIYIKNTFAETLQIDKHSYGEQNSLFGLVFYYKSLNSAKQSLINELNTISFEDLFDFANLGNDEDAKKAVAKELKVVALNLDGTVCNFVNVGASSLEINGVGEFIIRITSEYDYTIIFEIKLLSVYYASSFTVNYNGTDLTNSDTLEIVYNQTREIVSSLNNVIALNGNSVELYSNDFAIAFNMICGGVDVENASDYITNNRLGVHTINMKFDWNEQTQVYASLDSGFGLEYNLMLNKLFGLSDASGLICLFNIQRKFGTTNISTNLTDGSIEPNAPFVFEATLTTDVKEDYISKLDDSGVLKGVTVYNQSNYDCTDYFNIVVTKIDSNLDGVIDLDDNIYEIQVSLNLDAFYGEKGENIMNFVNKKYTVIVNAFNSAGVNTEKYSAFASVNFTLLPQTIANINTSLYNITSSTVAGVYVDEKETTTSVIMPSDSGLFVIDMFPSYASFDYLEVVATSNTMAKLSYRLEEYDPSVLDPEAIEEDTLGWIANYRTRMDNVDDFGNKIYEAIPDANGIRIYNNANYNAEFYNAYADRFDDRPHLNNVNNIGTYFIKIFADSSFDTDTIFTITVNAYLNGNVLTAQSSFTLYMRMPEAPQLTIDGQTKVYKVVGQEIIADVLVSDDQIDFTPYFAQMEGESEKKSVLDQKPLKKIILSSWPVSENDLIGYKRYKISIDFDSVYDYTIDSTQLKLVVETTKIFNGKSIKVSSDVFIYLVDYLPEENDIQIFGAIDGIFNVTSLKETELKLADLLLKNVNATENFVNEFNANYYYPVLNDTLTESITGFTFGKNIFTADTYKNKACVLASYLSYVNGNQKTALLNYYFDSNGEIQYTFNKDDFNRVIFDWERDDKGNITGIVVRGGDTTGKVEMSLDIQYKMPDNRYYTYEYRFAIVNSLYTTEDLPIEIANNADFIDIQNNDTAYDYILTKDLNLYDFATIANTDKIKSLDGNNHTINIWNFAKIESGTAVHALFNQVSAITTIKNLTVNLYYLSEIEFGDAVKDAQVAGFAITNNGAIYNCEVLAYKSTGYNSGSSVLGIKMSKDIEATVAGFVINNVGSITNSRVGGESKLVTSIEYIEDENGIVTKRNVKEETILTKQLAIQASGTISGFVVNNNGIVASSFVKNLNIQNTYYKQETRVTSGFVNNNAGTISLCYAEGDFANENEIQASIGGLEGSGIMSGFVYINNGTITDSYSNLMITNTRDQVGRLGAGFVFENSESGVIERSYSASKIISNNVTQMNFAGIKDFGGYNNYGTINKSYYYVPNNSDEISIESIFNTEINPISNMLNDENFYGFSFKTSTNEGSWTQSVRGPQLISPNNISHSLRAKYEKTDSVQSELNYIFEYCDGYELGTSNNPIIIRDALEFNSVFGGSNSTDIKANYSNGKIYGAYRLANNIDMLELVPEEEKQSEYKVNLISTKMVLTGEYGASTNRNGSLEGNGLTIKNLAISNSSTESDGFGLFKSIENGASISNLNITLSSGGVTADHTVFVGTLAGSLVDSNANNISISSGDQTETVKVIGANVVGGIFGRVIGESAVSNIEINNISVTSTYNSVLLHNNNIDDIIANMENLYDRKSGIYTNLSIAGGACGVIDIYTKQQYQGDVSYTEQSLNTTIQSVSVVGGFVIEGMCAGGVFGYIGEFVSAKDLSLTITNDVIASKIIAYNHFAGGIAGYSQAYLYQLKTEHKREWQTEIESNYNNYYISQNRDDIDRGNLELFSSDVGYEQKAVGGLIGVVNGGKVTIGYSKINVISNSWYSGGLFGYVSANYINAEASDSDTRPKLALSELYASGDVYSDHINARIGGLIGFFADEEAIQNITKLNAVNFWGEKSVALFDDTNLCYKNPLSDGKSIAPIANAVDGICNEKIAEDGYLKDSDTVLSIQGVQFANQTAKEFQTVKIKSMQSYYTYQGVVTDNGAQVDLMFKGNGWYNDNNWGRDTLEALPHIKYFNSNTAYIIRSTSDFYLFSLHGNEEDAIFVIDGIERPDSSNSTKMTKLIDCKQWREPPFAIIRGTIIGATNEDGFENLNVTLFRTTSGASISNLKFKNCSVALVNNAISTKFKTMYYTDCDFTKTVNGNIGGIAYTVAGLNSEFSSITFDDQCTLTTSDACNAGFLFASTENRSTSIQISNISILNEKTDSYSITKTSGNADLNYGLLFGYAGCEVSVSSATIYDNMKVSIGASSNANANNEINIGLIAGNALKLNVTLSEITLLTETSSALQNKGLQVIGPKNNGFGSSNVTFNVGGLVGQATTLGISANRDENTIGKISVYFAPEISVENMKSVATLQMGTLSGVVNTLSLSNSALYIVGQKQEKQGNSIVNKFVGLNYDLAEKSGDTNTNNKGSNFVGGLVGTITALTIEKLNGQGIDEEPFIAYYGDITVKDITQTDKATTLALGGLFGQATGGTQGNPSVIKNAFFDGTISFGSKLCKTLYVGGIVGYIGKDSYISIYNTVASGEILLKVADEATGNLDKPDIELTGPRYAGGLAGFVDGSLIVGSEVITQKDSNTGVTKSYYYTTAVITTVFTMKNYDNIDAIANISSDGNFKANTIDGLGVSLAQYSSSLTLCTSDMPHEGNGVSYVTNYPYSEIITENISDAQVVTNSVFDAVQASSTYKGTKLNPYILSATGANSLQTHSNQQSAKDAESQFYAITDENSLSYNMVSASNRKLYVYVQNDVKWLKKQLSLTNTFLFGDGSAIYSGITPINTIDKNSAVSGVIAKVYIDSTAKADTTGLKENEVDFYHVATSNYFGNDLHHYAGFVNTNSGIIYTCSVQECMEDTKISDNVVMNMSTQFYGYFLNKEESINEIYKGYAGFVAYNEGYIFGSNANMKFPKDNNLPVSGFVANNAESGVISYCYASGENYYSSEDKDNCGDLFTKQTPAIYKLTLKDFEYWIGTSDDQDNPTYYKDFWDNIARLVYVAHDEEYNPEKHNYDWPEDFSIPFETSNDFIQWAWKTFETIENDTTTITRTNIDRIIQIYYEEIKPYLQENSEEETEDMEETINPYNPYEQASLELYNDIYNSEIVAENVNKRDNNTGDILPDFYGTYENCYTIVMAKGKNISIDMPDNVYGETTSNEIKLNDTNNTILFNAINAIDPEMGESKLIKNDQHKYYNCDPDYNWNYPTITGAMFKHFAFLKRCTLCVYEEETENYLSKDKTYVTSPTNSLVKVLGNTIVRNTTDQSADINQYFTDLFYVQIPNATVLQKLQEFINGISFGNMDYKYKYTKFVMISNLNFGYDDGLLNNKSFIETLDTTEAEEAEGGIILDGYKRIISNLNIRQNAHFIDKIKGSKPIEIKKLTFESITLKLSSGIIGETESNVTLNLIDFPQSETIYYQAPELDVDNYVGILVRKNGGIITNSNFGATIQAFGKEEKIETTLTIASTLDAKTIPVGNSQKDYTFGAFAGLNAGKISDSTFYGKVQIIETVEGIDVTFGCFAGQNGISTARGEIENCLIKQGATNTYYLSEGGSIYLDKDDVRLSNDPILTIDQNGQECRTELVSQIYVSTKNEATVGGIAGVQDYGYIHKCLTFASPQNEENPVDYLGILVGNEDTQMKAVVGGIVGEIKGGTITDSANRMNITALSVWLFTTNSTKAEDYRYSVTDFKVERSGAYDTNEMYKINPENKSLKVHYDDANPDPIFKFDGKGMLYVYNEMTSLAYAGGIVGLGLYGDAYKNLYPTLDKETDLSWDISTASGKDANYSTKLVNYGTIKGGYRAVKPVATITPDINNTSGYPWGFYGGLALLVAGSVVLGVNGVNIFKNLGLLANLAGALGSLLVQAALKVQSIWGAVALLAMAAGGGLAVWMFSDALKAVTTPTFNTTAIIGNSLNYYKDTKFVYLICNNDDGYNEKNIKEKIVAAIKKPVPNEKESSFQDNYMDFVGSDASGAYAILFLASKIEQNFIETTNNIKGSLFVNSAKSYIEIIESQGADNTFLQLHKLLDDNTQDNIDYQPLKGYSYDGICPTIRNKNYTNDYIVYSSIENYNSNKTLHSGNLENNKLVFNNVNKLYNRQESISVEDWGENFALDEYDNVVPNVGLKQEVNPDNSETLETDGSAIYTITNPTEWEDVIFTINKRTKTNDENYNDYYLNAVIKINLSGGYESLEIEDNTLDLFNGTIISNTQYKIRNVILKNNKSYNYGLVKETNGGLQLYNLTFDGEITISNISLKEDAEQSEGNVTPEINGGILIGKVNNINEPIKLNNINVAVKQIAFDVNALALTSNFGGLIGNINSIDTSENYVEASNITINTSFKASTPATIAGDTTDADSTDNGFAGIVGKVQKGKFVLGKSTINGEIELGTNFNRVGSVVGSIGYEGSVYIGQGDASTATINMSVKAASKANTSVGGIIGYNAGNVTVLMLVQLANEKSLMVTADVVSFEYYACAGGIIGNNKGTTNNVETIIFIGKDMESYNDVGYVLAGYNQIEFFDVATSFPRENGTSAALIYGNDLTLTEKDMSYAKNIITKFIASDISKSEDLLSYFERNYSAEEYVQWNGLSDDINKAKIVNDDGSLGNEIDIDDELLNNMEFYTNNNKLTSKISAKSSQQSLEKQYNVTYSYKQLHDFKLNSNDNNLKTYQWLLNINYKAETYEYDICTSKMIDKYGKESSIIDLNYKFIIRLVSANAKLDDNGVYILQVIKLNDYQKSFTHSSISISQKIEGEEITANSRVEITNYKEIEYTPKVIFSKKINLTQYESTDFVTDIKIEDAIDYEVQLGCYDINDDVDLGNKDSSVHSNILLISLITNSFTIGIKKEDNNWKIAFNDVFDLEVEVSKSSANSPNEDEITDDDMENLENKLNEDQNYTASVLRAKGTYTRTLFEQTILNTDVNATEIKFTGAPKSTFTATLNGSPIKLEAGGNTNKVSDTTLSYTGNFKIGNHMAVSYREPIYKYKSNEYMQVNLYGITIEENDYLIISCLSNDGSVIEYIYLSVDKNGDGTPEPYECGYINYQISSTSTGIVDAYEDVVASRHSSFFPSEQDGITINNVKDYSTKPNFGQTGNLTVTYIYYSSSIAIDTQESILYCNITTTYQKNECAINVEYKNGSWTGTFASNARLTDSTSTSSRVIYNSISTTDQLRNIITIEEISTGYGITVDTMTTGIVLDEGQELVHRYVLNGNVIGYVYKYCQTQFNGSEEVNIWYWKAYSKQNASNNFREATIFESDKDEDDNITDMRCLFAVCTAFSTSNSLTAS